MPPSITPQSFSVPLHVELPEWVATIVQPGLCLPDDPSRMALAIQLSALQVSHGSGGPFGALVCNLLSGEVVAAGVNRVVPHNASIAHAEVLAWSGAQRHFATYDLGAKALPPLGLYTSAQPCIACWGGLFWTGLKKLVCGASKHDVERLTGFKEGPVPDNWIALLEQAGMTVINGMGREEACKVLQRYAEVGEIYNPGGEPN